MSDSRVGGYPMGVTDAAIERSFGGACEPRMCGNCRHFCGSDIHVDYGYCHLEFERAYDAEAPDRKEVLAPGEVGRGVAHGEPAVLRGRVRRVSRLRGV